MNTGQYLATRVKKTGDLSHDAVVDKLVELGKNLRWVAEQTGYHVKTVQEIMIGSFHSDKFDKFCKDVLGVDFVRQINKSDSTQESAPSYERKCLKCDSMFLTDSKFIRICDACKSGHEFRFHPGSYTDHRRPTQGRKS